jgi:2',3'-cyclic-nucleotide 2'-phosphodiesterase (5'-nucleotidase family)
MRNTFVTLLIALLATACASTPSQSDLVVITVVGTNDAHGELIPRPGRGGMTTFSGYVVAVRDARSADGALLLVDAGDMWQGTLESNLNEGYAVVEAYNAMGYAASTVGNHEFDFGPLGPKSIPESVGDNPQGALRVRADEASFPLLASNLIDAETGEMVAWDNVQASTMVERARVQIGIIGVLTESTPATTIAANTRGIRIAPLADAIEKQARLLREKGAALIVVVAHAGSRCLEFDDPFDTSSCEMSGEVMQVANALPAGLVDHIVAGHVHQGIAHDVNGIAVTASYSNTRAFSRVDFTVDRRSGEIVDRRVYPPQEICTEETEGPCEYEGRPVTPMPEVVAIAERAAGVAARRKAEKLGVYLETPMTLHTRPESILGNLMTDAILEASDADISLHNVYGGIRAELPEGELTYGSVFRMFPFDNRIAVIDMAGRDVRRIIEQQAHSENRPAGFSGMRVFVSCIADQMSIRMVRPDGSEIDDDDTLRVMANDFLLLGGDDIFTPVMPEGGFAMPNGMPMVRDVLVDWFKSRAGRMHADDFYDPQALRWNRPDPLPPECHLSAD